MLNDGRNISLPCESVYVTMLAAGPFSSVCYSLRVLFLLTVPANNTRGPRYMEKALAAIHQARLRHAVTLSYASSETQVGLFI